MGVGSVGEHGHFLHVKPARRNMAVRSVTMVAFPLYT